MNRGKETKYLSKLLNSMLLRIIFLMLMKRLNTWILTLQILHKQWWLII